MQQKTSDTTSRFRNLTVNTRISLILCGGISFIGINHIIADAHEVVAGHELYLTLTEREVDHLNWAGKVGLFFTDPAVTRLEVETDDHKCKLGKWLYGEERKQAEAMLPKLAPLFKEMEKPHADLHQSAVKIVALNSKEEAQATYLAETIPALRQVQDLLHQLRKEAEAGILPDEAMLEAAKTTKYTVGGLALLARRHGYLPDPGGADHQGSWLGGPKHPSQRFPGFRSRRADRKRQPGAVRFRLPSIRHRGRDFFLPG